MCSAHIAGCHCLTAHFPALPHTSLPYRTLSDVHRALLHLIVQHGFSSKPWGILTHGLALQTRNNKISYRYLISLHNGVPSRWYVRYSFHSGTPMFSRGAG